MMGNSKEIVIAGASESTPGLNQIIHRFEEAWETGQPPAIQDFLPPEPAQRGRTLVELVHVDLERRFRAGEKVRVESYLEQFPELVEDHQAVIDLICQEYQLRRRRETGLAPKEYWLRFPQYAEELASRLPVNASQETQDECPGHKVLGEPAGPGSPQSANKPGVSAAAAVESWPNLPGYKVVEVLGQGAMGIVYKAKQLALNRFVALKELLEKTSAESVLPRRFVEEARITGQLEHPGIVPVHALFTDKEKHPYYAMKLVVGQTFHEALQRHHKAPGGPGLKDLVRRLVMVCQTVAFAHSRGVVHRDLKPSNIMLGEFGETLVLDWGLARSPRTPDSEASHQAQTGSPAAGPSAGLTVPGDILGTPAYMAPEQAEGKTEQVGPASDIYALGAMLFQVLTGRLPYQGKSALEVLQQVKEGPSPKPAQVASRVPRPLEAICVKAMARQPRDRYASAQDMAQDLQHWLDDEAVQAYREPLGEWLLRLGRRHAKAAATGVAVLLLLMVILGIAGAWVSRALTQKAEAEEKAREYNRQAAEADRKAQEKENEAAQLAQEAKQARAEAEAAQKKADEAALAVAAARDRLDQLQTGLQAQTAQTEKLRGELTRVSRELALQTARFQAETARARAAGARAELLEKQVAALNGEVPALRELAHHLTILAGGKIEVSLSPPISNPWEDLSEQLADDFEVVSSSGETCLLTNDVTGAFSGKKSLHLYARNAGRITVTYPKSRNANWNLSTHQLNTFRLAYFLEDPRLIEGGAFSGGLKIRLGRGSRFLQLEPNNTAPLNFGPRQWVRLEIPLSGNAGWKASDPDGMDLSRVDWVEILMEAATPGCRIRLDDLGFGPDPTRPRPALVDPDRRFVEALARLRPEWNPACTLWLSGRQEVWNKTTPIPREPFKVLWTEFIGPGQLPESLSQLLPELPGMISVRFNNITITDGTMEAVSRLNGCNLITFVGMTLPEKTFEYLGHMKSLRQLDLHNVPLGKGQNGKFEHLQRSRSLTIVLMASVNIDDEGVAFLAGVSTIGQLGLQSLKITDACIKHLSQMPYLNHLTINSKLVTEEGIQHLGNSKVHSLYLGGEMELTGRCFIHFKDSPVSYLDLRGLKMDHLDPSYLKSLPRLTDLLLFGLSVEQTRKLAEVQGISYLEIGRFKGTAADECLAHLGKLKNLQKMNIWDPHISDTGLKCLHQLVNLQQLNIFSKKATPEGFDALKRALPKCQVNILGP